MADNCTLPNMSGRLNLLNQAFAFFKIVPSAAITITYVQKCMQW